MKLVNENVKGNFIFSFVKIKLSPTQCGWYLRLSQDDLEQHFTVSQIMAKRLFRDKFVNDVHWQAAFDRNETMAHLTHPLKLATSFSQSTLSSIFKNGEIFINRNGGFMTWLDGYEIIEEIEKDGLNFPPSDNDTFRKDFVRIGKWMFGTHYYLSSGNDRFKFSHNKFDTLQEAIDEALKHVPRNRIYYREDCENGFRLEGD